MEVYYQVLSYYLYVEGINHNLIFSFVIFPIFGLLLQIAILSNPLFNDDLQTKVECCKIAALIGGLLIWASSNCCKSKATATKAKADWKTYNYDIYFIKSLII